VVVVVVMIVVIRFPVIRQVVSFELAAEDLQAPRNRGQRSVLPVTVAQLLVDGWPSHVEAPEYVLWQTVNSIIGVVVERATVVVGAIVVVGAAVVVVKVVVVVMALVVVELGFHS